MVLFGGHFAEVLDEVHYIGSIVHIILVRVRTCAQSLVNSLYTNPFKLFQNTRVKILVQVAVFEGIVRGFLRRGDRSTQMLQLRRKAHAHLERICHHLAGVLFHRIIRWKKLVLLFLGQGAPMERPGKAVILDGQNMWGFGDMQQVSSRIESCIARSLLFLYKGLRVTGFH